MPNSNGPPECGCAPWRGGFNQLVELAFLRAHALVALCGLAAVSGIGLRAFLDTLLEREPWLLVLAGLITLFVATMVLLARCTAPAPRTTARRDA